MKRKPCEAGSMLIEVILVVAVIAAGVGTFGAFALAGPSVAVSAAATGIAAAFDEGRRTAVAFDAATVVFEAAPSGRGFSVRVYRRFPGDAAFAPENGPAYESATSAQETAAPLGSPGMAFAIDHRGAVTGYAGFHAEATSFDPRACPATGAYAIAIRSGAQARVVTIPCAIALAGVAPAAFDTAPPAVTPAPVPTAAVACAAGSPCPLPTLMAARTPAPTPVAPSTSAPAHQQVADVCGAPAGHLAFTDAATNPPTDHLTDGVACATPAPAATQPPSAFAGHVTIEYWIEECPDGIASCDGGTLLADESPQTILGGPVDYVACNVDPHPLGGTPRSMSAGTWHGSTVVAPFSTITHFSTRWDIVVSAGTHLAIADAGSAGC